MLLFKLNIFNFKLTILILSFRTDMPAQTVQTQIRLLLIRVYTICHSVCIVWTHYTVVEPHSSHFRVITTNVLGVRKFRKFTVNVYFRLILMFLGRARRKVDDLERLLEVAKRNFTQLGGTLSEDRKRLQDIRDKDK